MTCAEVTVPVVTTAVSGMAELVEAPGAGVLEPPGDIDGLAAALRRLMSDDEGRIEMGRRGRALILERYSIESVASQHEALYRAVIEGQPVRSKT